MKKYFSIILLYACYFFYYSIAEFLINDLTPVVFGKTDSDDVVFVYSWAIACVAAGLSLFYFGGLVVRQPWRRQRMLMVVCAANILLFWALPLLNQRDVYLSVTMLFMLSAGYIGGAVYYAVAVYCSDRDYTGRVIGLAIAAAVLAQYLAQAAAKLTGLAVPLQVCASLFALAGLLYILLFRLDREMIFGVYAPPENSRYSYSAKHLLAMIFIATLLTFMHGINDGILVTLHAEHAIDLTDLPRIFYAFGIIIAGIVADYRQRRFLAMATLAAMMASIFSILLLDNPRTYVLSSCATYFFASFYVMFITIVFIDIAPWTKAPTLWASMGRILKFAFTGFGAVVGEMLWRIMSLQTVIAIYTGVLLLLLIPVFVMQNPQKKSGTEPAAPVQVPEVRPMADYKVLFSLTNREQEVLELILCGQPIKEIALNLGISERTVKHHIANILVKTGAKNQKELLVIVNKLP